jgi:hypothetical protein
MLAPPANYPGFGNSKADLSAILWYALSHSRAAQAPPLRGEKDVQSLWVCKIGQMAKLQAQLPAAFIECSAATRRRSADAELWRPCEPDVGRGPGTKSESCRTLSSAHAGTQSSNSSCRTYTPRLI